MGKRGRQTYKRFDNFPIGAEPEGAGVRIEELIEDHSTQRDTLYRCRASCCGAELFISHQQIKKKMYDKPKTCRSCRGELPDGMVSQGAPAFNHGPQWPITELMLAAHLAGWEGK